MTALCVIFDIDGTLLDSDEFDSALYKKAVREVLGDVRIRMNWREYEHVTDAGTLLEICKDNGLELGNSDQEVRTRFGELISAYLRDVSPCIPVLGAIPFWQKLSAYEDTAVGIATGGWGHTARMKLESARIPYAGVPLASSDDSHERVRIMQCCRRSLPPTASTIYMGDGEWDQLAASRLGWRFIGVGKGVRGVCSEWISDFTSADLLDRIFS
jgi:phosphoglycolate phosphatase-like HAD superfamily hydrolase